MVWLIGSSRGRIALRMLRIPAGNTSIYYDISKMYNLKIWILRGLVNKCVIIDLKERCRKNMVYRTVVLLIILILLLLLLLSLITTTEWGYFIIYNTLL